MTHSPREQPDESPQHHVVHRPAMFVSTPGYPTTDNKENNTGLPAGEREERQQLAHTSVPPMHTADPREEYCEGKTVLSTEAVFKHPNTLQGVHYPQFHQRQAGSSQEFHGSPQASMTVRPRHFSGGESASDPQGTRYTQFSEFAGQPAASMSYPKKSEPYPEFSQSYRCQQSTWHTTQAGRHQEQMMEHSHQAEHYHVTQSSEYQRPSRSSGGDSELTSGSYTCYLTLPEASGSQGQGFISQKSGMPNLPEIQMSELTDSGMTAPWLSHTPDNLSPTVQIVQKLSQATVSDSQNLDSPLTTSSGNTSPRTSTSMVLQVPGQERSPSLSPISGHKHRQLFVFPDVNQMPGKSSFVPTLEAAGLNVSVSGMKSDTQRWRHVSSGSSGDSSNAGDNSNVARPAVSASSANVVSRERFLSGDTDVDDTLVDSETSSSVVEDSGSSREQSPFSGTVEPGRTHSPGSRKTSPLRHIASPSGRRSLHRQQVVMGDEDCEGVHDAERGHGGEDEKLQPPKFKRRLHQRYVSSLKEEPSTGSEPGSDGSLLYVHPDCSVDIKPILKLETVGDELDAVESSMPKSPRRSLADESCRGDSHDLSADEGDVFMEPVRAAQKPKPRNQQQPLDLSRAPVGSSPFHAMYRTASLPESETPTSSPGPKSHYSPLFRSSHRLNYSPHGLLSPQSQSPLCSVPEGGRIFSFNTYEAVGAHSDTDIISPSPMSPRFFTFPSINPSHTTTPLLNPMSEVNRLAVSPRALYPTSPIQFSLRSKSVAHVKWENFPKRSFSDSDVAYQCPVCSQVFPSNDNLAKHMAKHLPTETIRSADNNKIHYCKVCERSFSRSDMLTRHMRLHTGLKPYVCMDCNQVFSRSDHLNTHKRTHTGEKPYRCPQCPYAACRRDMITRHMRTHSKRAPKRGRYLSVPDEGTDRKNSEASESQDISVVRPCSSLSSIESLDLEMGQGHRRLMQASVESLPSTDDPSNQARTSTSSKESEDLDDYATFSPTQWMSGRKMSETGPFQDPRTHQTSEDDPYGHHDTISDTRPQEPQGYMYSPGPKHHLHQRSHQGGSHYVTSGSGPSSGTPRDTS
ncbi:uncharacterized protein LOC131941729 [Physella acuta]|uniref:uncharacterized protein LOC131941729 n=1 Tax=Physella acuta TaxID=109671 RepID=UPI0027DD1AF3|nr:uncharacterized protein LOC131941729 [Physella acuta]XP_059157177.1 uncharacterized protein LOC131941729 [Physella acuta]XP_059157178.1 uncharacterized protein LOC131941729 [Physella acuta]XP_059157179.1 uncharacterized protein LOC131941729 [Physella acuta]XP_059157180.1 uncharacterized protein LOC131941729 [Physella acuta]